MGGRVVDGARLESAYRSKAYRGFESHLIRQISAFSAGFRAIIFLFPRSFPQYGWDRRGRVAMRARGIGNPVLT